MTQIVLIILANDYSACSFFLNVFLISDNAVSTVASTPQHQHFILKKAEKTQQNK